MTTLRRLLRSDRPVSEGEGVCSRHGLSFGAHYDPERTSFGALVAHNDDVLGAGVAYGAHEHRDVEILAWVLDGAMVHTGPDGHETRVPAGTLQHLVAGTGWHHDERAADEGPVHLLQLWVTPGLDDPPAGEPSLTHHRPDLDAGPFTLDLRRPGVTVTLARLGAGERWAPADGAFRHVHVARGALGEASPTAEAGDSLEIAGTGPVTLEAGPDGAELVVVTTA
ncbi:pirin family protein [Actinomycetospora lemnae]|uniref:Pirin family protein n=1 Tax=Actinomycetospora lemnae TaxID=3019891 RepID=A0ABT5SWQ6_9PSEU|nr:pirin family protein [Actinomycetospora sp. DW7H6]MDD7967287.1 pirin family protein [Actinomycetospora sp. DW7H6]